MLETFSKHRPRLSKKLKSTNYSLGKDSAHFYDEDNKGKAKIESTKK